LLAKRIQAISKSESENINAAYKILFSRQPSPNELELAMFFLHASEENNDKPINKMDRWERMAQALLASNEFMYID
jgi:hypothetical protein